MTASQSRPSAFKVTRFPRTAISAAAFAKDGPLVETPSNAMASEMASQAMTLDLNSDRAEQIASRGMKDPAALRPEEVKALCAAVMAFIEGSRKKE